jgi:hypothetical protein
MTNMRSVSIVIQIRLSVIASLRVLRSVTLQESSEIVKGSGAGLDLAS